MNKKTLFLIFFSGFILVLPGISNAEQNALTILAVNIQQVVFTIGLTIVAIGWTIAGILWLTSAGSPEKTGTAKKAMIAAVIGTILIALVGAVGGIITFIQSALFQGI